MFLEQVEASTGPLSDKMEAWDDVGLPVHLCLMHLKERVRRAARKGPGELAGPSQGSCLMGQLGELK